MKSFYVVICSIALLFLQDYTITMYLNQYWRDERLAFNAYSLMMDNMDDNEYTGFSEDEEEAKDMITLSGDFAEKIWVPDTFFANDKNRFVLNVTKSLIRKLIK